jgi:hypothetical protein
MTGDVETRRGLERLLVEVDFWRRTNRMKVFYSLPATDTKDEASGYSAPASFKPALKLIGLLDSFRLT